MENTVPICQSCSMPMVKPEEFGSADYCIHCFRDGQFTHPDMTMEDMIDHLASFASQMGQPEQDARRMAGETLPKLKRWQTA